MSSLHQVATQYRSLRFSNIAEALERLIGEAEASEATYLQFAEQLVMHEMSSRDVKRIAQNMRRAGNAHIHDSVIGVFNDVPFCQTLMV